MQMPTVSRARAIAYLAVILGLLALGGKVLAGSLGNPGREQTGGVAVLDTYAESDAPAGAAGSPGGVTEGATIVVHVVGAVRRPGLYRLPEGSRVDDALREAGGARPVADLSLVNLAAPVVDGQQIVVPRPVEVSAGQNGATAGSASAGSPTAPTGPLHLNSATLEQLDMLPGVGPVTAQRILGYREEHAGFRSVDELDAVPGIGPARLEQLRELVVP